MTTQTPTIAEIEKWLRIRVRFFLIFWLRVRVRRKNAESCRSRLLYSGSGPTSASLPLAEVAIEGRAKIFRNVRKVIALPSLFPYI